MNYQAEKKSSGIGRWIVTTIILVLVVVLGQRHQRDRVDTTPPKYIVMDSGDGQHMVIVCWDNLTNCSPKGAVTLQESRTIHPSVTYFCPSGKKYYHPKDRELVCKNNL